jgi:hypothetical protein
MKHTAFNFAFFGLYLFLALFSKLLSINSYVPLDVVPAEKLIVKELVLLSRVSKTRSIKTVLPTPDSPTKRT